MLETGNLKVFASFIGETNADKDPQQDASNQQGSTQGALNEVSLTRAEMFNFSGPVEEPGVRIQRRRRQNSTFEKDLQGDECREHDRGETT